MKTSFLGLQRTADTVIKSPLDRSRIVAAAVAVAVAAQVGLPSSPVEDASLYYTQQALARLEATLGEFNENLVFDLSLALQYARQFWMTRYRAAHPEASSFVMSSCGFFETLSGVPLHVSPQDVQFLNANKDAVLQLAAAAAGVLATLK